MILFTIGRHGISLLELEDSIVLRALIGIYADRDFIHFSILWRNFIFVR